MTHRFFTRLQTALPDALFWLGETVVLAVGLLLVWHCLRVFGRIGKAALAGRGKTRVEPFGLPDLLVVSVHFAWMGGSVLRGFWKPGAEHPLTDTAIFESALLFGSIVGGIALFLHARQIPVGRLFGLRPARLGAVLGKGAGYFLAALPLVLLCSILVQSVAGEPMRQQEIVEYFTKAARQSDRWRLLLASALGVVVAPVTEEFLFRGYFYGVLRRFVGTLPAMLLTAALFAGIHLNGPVFLPLFVFAVCLTLAYEATGSLLTCIFMHALFNAAMLAMMVYSAGHNRV